MAATRHVMVFARMLLYLLCSVVSRKRVKGKPEVLGSRARENGS